MTKGKPTIKTNRCRRCGRELTDPKSISIGVGPKCLKKELEKAIEASHHFKMEAPTKTVNTLDKVFINVRREDERGD